MTDNDKQAAQVQRGWDKASRELKVVSDSAKAERGQPDDKQGK